MAVLEEQNTTQNGPEPVEGPETYLWREKPLLRIWTGFLLAPAAYFLQLGVAYGAVPWVCRGGSVILLHGVTLIALAACALGGYMAWAEYRLGVREDEDVGRGAVFLALGSAILSALFFVAILGHEVPNWIVGPCVGR